MNIFVIIISIMVIAVTTSKFVIAINGFNCCAFLVNGILEVVQIRQRK